MVIKLKIGYCLCHFVGIKTSLSVPEPGTTMIPDDVIPLAAHTARYITWGYYYETDPDPIEMVIRVTAINPQALQAEDTCNIVIH